MITTAIAVRSEEAFLSANFGIGGWNLSNLQDHERDEGPSSAHTFMFTDMEGSTAMIERFGDVEAHKVVQAHDEILRRRLALFGGREVERHGDGFLLVFDSARRALLFGLAVQYALAAYERAHPEHPIRVRIGLHRGPALQAGEGFFGKSVVVAARIAALANGGEILASNHVLQAVKLLGEIICGQAQVAELKGLSGTYLVHPVTGRASLLGRC
jgi:adenylate cyclase